MPEAPDIEVVVFDILGTMVDEPGGLRDALREALPTADEAAVDRLLAGWREQVEHEQRRVGQRRRPYANTEVIDREAARRVAECAGLSDPAVVERLATASRRLRPWPDAPGQLARLARRYPVLGLSNASRATLLRLNAHAGLRWHQALSAEEALAYKPLPEVYRLALAAAGCPADRVLMVAAHAWDLRGAQVVGMRTAYVRRPEGDPPAASDAFDWRTDGLTELVTALTPAD
ncbi:haloacid dehalogenase type II [Streptomyces sp. DSM 44915]|uniref:Haloacid dehalogenase type II n=1 Tax=Streptomyces chisholmiae TaxID=3075540 RepID=A0ABU2JQ34_9ACTN|nr:haloacid dehalogenase type II [Streptomyces sp. DSM 44915]MDT0267080.1 haloacid dehalogenase type II [Streptomyces sp. DSM 44915]